MSSFVEVFGAEQTADRQWSFDLTQRFNGAFGGTNGGVLSAISLYAARSISARQPTSIDSRYIRGFRPGQARVAATIINAGRTLSILRVDVIDTNDRLCTQSTITLVQPSALVQSLNQPKSRTGPRGLKPWAEGKPWKQPKTPVIIPLIETFVPTALGGQERETITGSNVLFSDSDLCAEASCIAADLSVGPPVARAVKGAASTPNPDLSLRFCGSAINGTHLVAACELMTIDAGLASTRISVWNDEVLMAVGISTTTCLAV